MNKETEILGSKVPEENKVLSLLLEYQEKLFTDVGW